LAGTVTAFCGPIGFVGIAIPHIARMLFRSADHRVLLPATILVGVVMLLVGDIVAKYFALPINTITALMGIPIVIYIVTRRR
jgi:iron complex transport system permease protein